MALEGTKYTVRQQLFTIHQNFEVFDSTGAKVMSPMATAFG